MKHTSPHRIVVCFSFICAHLVELCCEMVCTQSESEVHSTKSLSASASLFSFFFFPFIASIRPFTCALDLSSSRYQSAFGWCIDRKYCKPVKLRYTRKIEKNAQWWCKNNGTLSTNYYKHHGYPLATRRSIGKIYQFEEDARLINAFTVFHVWVWVCVWASV